MTLSIVKNEATAALRVGFPVVVYDADGQLINTNPTFAHGTVVSGVTGVAKEVEVWNGTDWVEAANNPAEVIGATGTASGVFEYQFTQAETNIDKYTGVRLCKTGYTRPFYLVVPTIAEALATAAGVTAATAPLATSAALTIVDDFIDTEIGTLVTNVAAIKAITDLLTLSAIADAVHDEVVEGAHTFRQYARGYASALFGKVTYSGTSRVFRDVDDTKDRITATVDASGRVVSGLVLT